MKRLTLNWITFLNRGWIVTCAFAIGLVIIGATLAWCNWDWLRDQPEMTASNGENARNVGFLVAGALAIVFAIWRAMVATRQAAAAEHQVTTAQTGLLNDRYQRGAEMMGHGVLAVRMAGIFALHRLAEEYPEQYHVQIMKLFCAFVRNPTPDEKNIREETQNPPFDIQYVREDVQTAISVIGLRDSNVTYLEREAGFRLDFRGASLRFADLRSHSFVGANFSNAILKDANLDDADLSEAVLMNADLSVAHAVRTKFNNSNCLWAALSSIDGRGSEFTGAVLEGTDFTSAVLHNAVFRCARFKGTLLGNAELENADVSRAVFTVGRQWSGVPRQLALSASTVITQIQLDETRANSGECPVIDPDTPDEDTGHPLVFRRSSNP